MLTLYRRHKNDCPHTDRYLKNDAKRCPVWVEGVLDGSYRRHSLKTSSWERAEQIRRELERGRSAEPVTIEFALSAFLDDQKARSISEGTQRKIKPLIATLRTFCAESRLTTLPELDLNHVRRFRAAWKDSPISALKKLERLRSFFNFCVASGWIAANPAKILKNPIVTNPPTLPFTEAELQRILQCAIGKWRVLILVLLYSGLRIGDAVQLTPEQIQEGRLFLYTQKTNVPVRVPLPDFVLHELGRLPITGGYYFWKREPRSKEATASGNARRALRRIFNSAQIPKGHPHQFRDTFAVRLLKTGVPLQDVSILLGHSSIKVTEKHYAPWVEERQTRLDELVQRAWKAPLVRVK